MKGLSYSSPHEHNILENLAMEQKEVYERIWDEADYVIPSSENNAFFIMTNVIITPNQVRSKCAEDPSQVLSIICNEEGQMKMDALMNSSKTINKCEKGRIINNKSHGRETGDCVKTASDEHGGVYTCEINGWCPVELDTLPKLQESLIHGTENFTVFIKNSISIPSFESELYRRNNMPNGICNFKINNESSWLCPIFRIGDIVELATGN